VGACKPHPISYDRSAPATPKTPSTLLATADHDRTTQGDVTMSSEAPLSYSGVAARDSSRLHAGHVYNNVVNSKRSLITCIMWNGTILIRDLRLLCRSCCRDQHSESQITTFTAKSARARRQSGPPRALSGRQRGTAPKSGDSVRLRKSKHRHSRPDGDDGVASCYDTR
jgi:hypothetical protein